MSASINPAQSQSVTPVSGSAPSSADAVTAGAAASTNASAEATGNTKFSSLEDLKTKAPKVYNQMMLSIATSMISDMHKKDERLKEMWRKSRENA